MVLLFAKVHLHQSVSASSFLSPLEQKSCSPRTPLNLQQMCIPVVLYCDSFQYLQSLHLTIMSLGLSLSHSAFSQVKNCSSVIDHNSVAYMPKSYSNASALVIIAIVFPFSVSTVKFSVRCKAIVHFTTITNLLPY